MLSQDEIDSLLASLSVGLDKPAPSPTSGMGESHGAGSSASSAMEADLPAVPADKQRSYKLYNFRRPDKFSKDHLRALQTIHESFARQLGLVMTAYLRMTVEIDVVSVDQLTYDEFVRSMPRPITVCILELAPLPGQVLLGLGYEVTMSIIDRMLGGPGQTESKPRELTDIEQSLIKRVIDRTLISLEEAWRSMTTISTQLMGMEESYALIQVASPGEIVALITFEVNLGNRDSGLMSLCIPYPVLEGVIDSLSAQHIFHRQQRHTPEVEQDKILRKMQNAKMPVSVLLGGTELHLKDLMALRVGDVIRLDNPVQSDLILCVNQKPKFYCRPGTLKQKLAVSINGFIDNQEILEGFGLDDD
ncbi:MAG: flagellar motor switch protein FliM [Candidatus Melainabacteria bacterium]|nr:flagellar motor switch protein FliM [Candidatus Melainabacteria bacterium]